MRIIVIEAESLILYSYITVCAGIPVLNAARNSTKSGKRNTKRFMGVTNALIRWISRRQKPTMAAAENATQRNKL